MKNKLNTEVVAEIRNKVTAAKTALERLSKGEDAPESFIKLALNELDRAVELLSEIK